MLVELEPRCRLKARIGSEVSVRKLSDPGFLEADIGCSCLANGEMLVELHREFIVKGAVYTLKRSVKIARIGIHADNVNVVRSWPPLTKFFNIVLGLVRCPEHEALFNIRYSGMYSPPRSDKFRWS